MKWTALGVFLLTLIISYNLVDDFDPGVLSGKRVLVTGASMGIGEQMAYHYAKLGARLIITARTESRLKQVIERCHEVGDRNGDYFYITADMEDYRSAHAVIEKAEQLLGGLDFLILNHIMASPLGEWHGSAKNLTLLDKIFDINFKAYVHLTSHALPMLEKGNGSIVVVTSIAGRISQPYVISYSASKFALDGFYSGLRQEFLLRNIDVSITQCVMGLIGTNNAIKGLRDFGVHFLIDKFPTADPADAALAIIRGGALRLKTIYYPFVEARFTTLLRDWIPSALETLVRFCFQRS
ncbi:hypothetical protein LSH36_297g00030 [Paralvinella palmiformis]|uniref:Uncharacterized protein n=1 Tax=Paralvinella palmiformis TaxID=53620 RepID=A0AAD9N3Z3_9ANNE|nr:hypothetical protein LSH36_297g00030 [Paralvinella palmiformis]